MDPKKPKIPFFAKDVAGSNRTGVTINVSRIEPLENDGEPSVNREDELEKFKKLGIEIVGGELEDKPFKRFIEERELAHHS